MNQSVEAEIRLAFFVNAMIGIWTSLAAVVFELVGYRTVPLFYAIIFSICYCFVSFVLAKKLRTRNLKLSPWRLLNFASAIVVLAFLAMFSLHLLLTGFFFQMLAIVAADLAINFFSIKALLPAVSEAG